MAPSSIPHRILVKEVNWLGDLVMSLPALRALRGAFPQARLSVLIRRELAAFFDGVDWIDQVLAYSIRRGARGLADQWKLIRRLRTEAFDLAVLFPNSFNSATWPFLAGVPRRVGYAADGRRLLLTDCAAPTADATNGHQQQYWLAMLRETLRITLTAEHRRTGDGAAGPASDPRTNRSAAAPFYEVPLEVSPGSVAAVRNWLDARRRRPGAPLLALAPGAAYGPAKEWPAARYIELIDLLAGRFGAESILVGAATERQRCEQLAHSAAAGAIVAAGLTTVGELKALLSICAGFVGNDSGAMHLAGALGIATVGIFGSTNPRRTGPRGPRTSTIYHRLECSPCLRRTCRYDHYHCLRNISPDEVVGQLLNLGALPARH